MYETIWDTKCRIFIVYYKTLTIILKIYFYKSVANTNTIDYKYNNKSMLILIYLHIHKVIMFKS